MIGAIEVHPQLSRLGFPFDPLRELGGRPLLARTVEAALRCPALDTLWILAPAASAGDVRRALGGLAAPESPAAPAGRDRKRRHEPAGPATRCRVLAGEGQDIPERARLRRWRRLAPSSWRAGWAIPFAVAEEGNPHWLLSALERSGQEHVITFPQAAPFLDPELLAEIIAEAEKHPAAVARLSTAPPGLAGDVFSRTLLLECARTGAPADLPLRFLPDRPDRALESKAVFHWFREEVSGFTTRLTAESRRGLEVLALVDRLLAEDGGGAAPEAGASGGDAGRAAAGAGGAGGASTSGGRAQGAGAWLKELSARPEVLAGPVPQELRVWVTTRVRTPSSLDPPPAPPAEAGGARPPGELDMDPALFSRLASELGRFQECRLVIAGGEPLLHPRIGEILESARASGVGVIQLETDGRGLEGPVLELLLAHTDLVSVAIDAVRSETYLALKGVPALREVEEGVERLLERAAAAGGAPLVAVELRVVQENRNESEAFFDRWYPRTPLVVVRGPSDRAGQLEARAVHPARTPERIPCLRLLESLSVLPDGRAVACENGFRGLLPAGDLRFAGVSEVWTGEPLRRLREAHARRLFSVEPLCERCSDWCRR